MNPRYVFYPHTETFIDVLQRVADGELKRVMVFAPPRHGKSETVSRLFPAYYLSRHPRRWFGLNSYAAELAHTLSRNARENYEHSGNIIKKDAGAVKHWETQLGGGLWAAGVGGPITGKGFHVGSIDDYLKNAEDAASETVRRKQWDWWQSTFLTRAEPDAAIIVTATRWNEDDLAGRIIKQEQETDDPETWHVVNFEAIKTDVPIKLPEHFTIEPDSRDNGEALCEERYSQRTLSKIEKKVGAYYWSALYQQRPSPLEGSQWKREWFTDEVLFDKEPDDLMNIGYDWDTAYTDKEKNSASAYVKAGHDSEGTIWILDIDFKWYEFPELVQWMVSTGGPHYIEKKASGKSAKQSLDREGIYATEVDVQGGDKIARTSLVTPIASARKLRVRRSIVDRLLDDPDQGILKFPNGSHDDLNDSLTQALTRLGGSPVDLFIVKPREEPQA